MTQHPKARLVLEDGSVYLGYSFGSGQNAAGEVVFNTGMAGYPQSLTDPSYAGQILTFTYPLIGNYGVDESCLESDRIQVQGLIVSEYCEKPSHWSSGKKLDEWLKENNVPALYGIDTRALTRKIREKGVMLGKIIIDKDIEIYDPNTRNLVADVSRKDVTEIGEGKYKIIVVDCGIKENIIRCLLKRDVKLKVVPWDYDFNKEDYDGLFISNGPGDPTQCIAAINNIKKAIEKKKPIFGICLGNQLLALAAGAKTYKLKYGHRSHNQPCICNGNGYITSQNHGFAVDTSTLPDDWEEFFYNGNDNTNEGIKHKSLPFRSVQFHPEGNSGPKDTEFLFDEFVEMIKNEKSIDFR